MCSGATSLVFTSSVSACESIVRFAFSRLCAGTTWSIYLTAQKISQLGRTIDEKCLCSEGWRMLISQNMVGLNVWPTFPMFHVLLKTCKHITAAWNSDPNHIVWKSWMHEVNRKNKTQKKKNEIITRACDRDENQSTDKITKAKRKQISIASIGTTINKNMSTQFQLRLNKFWMEVSRLLKHQALP